MLCNFTPDRFIEKKTTVFYQTNHNQLQPVGFYILRSYTFYYLTIKKMGNSAFIDTERIFGFINLINSSIIMYFIFRFSEKHYKQNLIHNYDLFNKLSPTYNLIGINTIWRNLTRGTSSTFRILETILPPNLSIHQMIANLYHSF